MSQYSEMMGSFIRTGNYPMEAHYIFESLKELIDFYNDPINRTTLHVGLFRIVQGKTKDEQALYWVVPNEDGFLYFEKLVDYKTINNVDELRDLLELEIRDRKLADDAIWGTRDTTEINDDLNSILKLSEAILDLRDKLEVESGKYDLIKKELLATVGTEEDDIIAYLNTLDYTSLTSLSEALNKFLNTIDDEDVTINTLPELQLFLEGFEYTHNLYECFKDLWNIIEGTPTPNDLFRTLRGIQDFIETLASACKNRMDNILTELDLTQVGVGLSGDGAYNADQETYYLKEATSVMNALKILDSLINQAINNCNILAEDTNTVDIDIVKEVNKTTISANVILSPNAGNDIQSLENGLYYNIDSEYENGILTIKVNGNVRQQHVLGLSSIVDTAYYDLDTEAIVIVFKLHDNTTQTINIPVGALIREWEVDNSNSSKVVELTKERVIAGGADKLSADVRLSTNKYNILEKEGNTLLVKGLADNIVYDGDVTVKSKLDSLTEHDTNLDTQISDLDIKINNEISRAKEAEEDLDDKITAETVRAKAAEKALDEKYKDEITESRRVEENLVNSLTSEIARSIEKDAELEAAIKTEHDRSLAAETKLTLDLRDEVLRSTNTDTKHDESITKLTGNLADLNTKVDNEVSRAILKENEISGNLLTEITRATDAETLLLTNITNEVTRATNAEILLGHRIDDLKDYIDTNTDNDTNLATRVTNLETNLTEEINRAKLAETELDNKIKQETERATNKEAALDRRIDNTNADLTSEIARAKEAEKTIQDNLTAEITRSTNADALHDKVISNEINRATLAEHTLLDNIDTLTTTVNTEIAESRRVEADLTLKLNDEITRSVTKDNELSKAITDEVTRATTKENLLLADLDAEILRSTTLDNSLTKELLDLITKCISANATNASEALNELAKLGTKYSTVEEIGKTLKAFLEDSDFADTTINKWLEIESFLLGITDQETLLDLLQQVSNNSITEITNVRNELIAETNRAKEEEAKLLSAINKTNEDLANEISRSTTIDSQHTSDIATNAESIRTEVDRAKRAEIILQNNIDSEVKRATNAETLLDHRIDDIEKLVETNQTAIADHDKAISDIEAKNVEQDANLKVLDNKIVLIKDTIETNINVKLDSLLDSLNLEISRSTLEDADIRSKVSELSTNLANEITRATAEEDIIKNSVAQEKERAMLREDCITTKLTDHINDHNNPHQVTAEQINVYTKDKVNELLKDVTDNLDTVNDQVNILITDLKQDFNDHIHDYNNPHKVTKAQIGLDKVDNTTDLEKPISLPTLNALNELDSKIDTKADAKDLLDHILDHNNPHVVTKDQVGLGNVDNTSDIDKPVSNATLRELDKKSDIGHKHTMTDITDLENLPIIKGFINTLADLPETAEGGDKYVLTSKVGSGATRYTLCEFDGSNSTWKQKLLTTGGIACVINGDVWKLNSSGIERMLDVSDYSYFYNKIYDETKDLIEDIDWEENDETSDTNNQIRLKITYKTKYGDPNESEVTNPYVNKAVKYLDIDKARFLANAYSRPAILSDVDNGYATKVGEPLLILVMTTGDHVTISLKDTLNIYNPVDTPSIDMSVSDWTGDPSTSYKISGDVRIATNLDKTDAISLHILNNTEKGLYGTLHTLNTNSISLNPATGAAGTQKTLTADLNINNSLNNNSDVLLTIDSSGLSAKLIWGEYE